MLIECCVSFICLHSHEHKCDIRLSLMRTQWLSDTEGVTTRMLLGEFPDDGSTVRPPTHRYAWELVAPGIHNESRCNLCTPIFLGCTSNCPLPTLHTVGDEKARSDLLTKDTFVSRDDCAKALTRWITGMHVEMETRMWRLLNDAAEGGLAETTIVAEEIDKQYYDRPRWPCAEAPRTVHVQPRACMRKRRIYGYPAGEYYTPRLIVQVASAHGLLRRDDYAVYKHPHWWNVFIVLPRGDKCPGIVAKLHGPGPKHDFEVRACTEKSAFTPCNRDTLEIDVGTLRDYAQERREKLLSGPGMGVVEHAREMRSIAHNEEVAALITHTHLAPLTAGRADPSISEEAAPPRSTTPLKPALRRTHSSLNAYTHAGRKGRGESWGGATDASVTMDELATLRAKVAELEAAQKKTRKRSISFSPHAPAPHKEESLERTIFTRHGDMPHLAAAASSHAASTSHTLSLDMPLPVYNIPDAPDTNDDEYRSIGDDKKSALSKMARLIRHKSMSEF